MRDIKFRAWHSLHKEMVNFDNNKVCEDNYQQQFLCNLMRGDYGDVLMQFTGLTDKNGVDIYEGDILINHLGRICKVEWHEYQAGFDCVFVKDTDFKRDIDLSRGFRNHQLSTFAEIIGNIHQDKELLND